MGLEEPTLHAEINIDSTDSLLVASSREVSRGMRVHVHTPDASCGNSNGDCGASITACRNVYLLFVGG
jgi:hypothetical protein